MPDVTSVPAGPARDPGGATGSAVEGRSTRARTGLLIERYGAVGILLLAILVFSLLRPETFPTVANLKAILVSQSVLALLCLGLLVPLAAGEFDLSIGFAMSFFTMLLGALTAFQRWDPVVAMVATILVALLIGLVNGILVVRFRVNSFIATLGVGTILSGITIWISNGQIIGAAMVTTSGTQIGIPDAVLFLGDTRIYDIRLPIFLMLIAAVVMWLVLGHMQFGRFLYAVGGGREVARLAGLRTDLLIVAAFMISSALAGFTSIVALGLFGSAHPDVGNQYLLPAFAACFLGATAIQAGRFNVWGTLVAIFLLAVLVAGFQQLGAPFWVTPVFNGLALVVAVALARSREWRT
jgi:ribose transport system permease protein